MNDYLVGYKEPSLCHKGTFFYLEVIPRNNRHPLGNVLSPFRRRIHRTLSCNICSSFVGVAFHHIEYMDLD